MKSFKDKSGGVWQVDIDLTVIGKVKKDAEINLIDLVLGKAGESLADDLEKQARILWLVVEEQALKEGRTPEAFAKSLNGDAIADAWTAIGESTADFLSSGQRGLAQLVMKKGNEVREAAVKLATAKLNSVDASKLVMTLSGGRTSLQGSPAKTRRKQRR